jgi:cysteine synthase A
VAQPAAAPPPVALDAEAERFFDHVVRHEPVVLFALEWCEFSWSVRKLFARLGIAYRSVDLDSVAFQAGDLGNKIRAVLAARTGTKTIPQVFIGGTHVGGATDLFEAWRSGAARALLAKRGVQYDAAADLDPYALLPKWLQPRKSA